MTKEEIDHLITGGSFLDKCEKPQLIETHISWVIVCNDFVYKIKKNISYPFLDFSTVARRKHFCEREIELNKRLTSNMYLDVQPVLRTKAGFRIGEMGYGEVVDHAVRMRKMDREKQMDVLLRKKQISEFEIHKLAEKVAEFHSKAAVISDIDVSDIQSKFNAISQESDYLGSMLGPESPRIINKAIASFDAFMKVHEGLLTSRVKTGFFRDCHGDLHSRNIFLLPEPIIFDCIEFNDDYRQIDVLNEVAFLCMDLDAFGREDLSKLFLTSYNNLVSAMRTKEEETLFLHYKIYRANVRAKVNSLRARSTQGAQQKKALLETKKYLHLMDSYFDPANRQG